MPVKVVVDPGSTHMGRLDYARKLIDLAVENKCWAIKFQMFDNIPPNIPLPKGYWRELVSYAKGKIIIFASAFGIEQVEFLKRYRCPYIKFAYSQRKDKQAMELARTFAQVIVSCDPLERFNYPEDIALFCIPEYPVRYIVDFSIIKQFRFDGFSDHTIGYWQTRVAVHEGARIIEKHITLDYMDIDCPDHYFALKPKELKAMMEVINRSLE